MGHDGIWRPSCTHRTHYSRWQRWRRNRAWRSFGCWSNLARLARQLPALPKNSTYRRHRALHLKERHHAGLVALPQESRIMIYAANYKAINSLLGLLTENCSGGLLYRTNFR